MSSSERQLLLTTDNPQAELLLVDSNFKVVARGPSPLRCEIAPGIYGCKSKVGEQEIEDVIAVQAGEGVLQKFVNSPRIESPIPLGPASTAKTDSHRRQAYESSVQTVNLPAGSSAIMVCLRDPREHADDPVIGAARAEAFRDLLLRFSIERLDGDFQFEYSPASDDECDSGYATRHVVAPPGAYALRYEPSDGEVICLSLPTAANWVLQVFVNMVDTSAGAQPDLPGIAMFFDRPGQPFNPERRDMLVVETVRKSLLFGRTYVTQLDDLLTGKFDNPMLGIYAAHALLTTPQVNAQLCHVVVQNMGNLLGRNFPDVVALRLELETPMVDTLETEIQQISGPPLLGRSWDVLMRLSNRVKRGQYSRSPLFSIASHLTRQGLFVAWTASRKSAVPAKSPTILSSILAGAGGLLRSARLTAPGLPGAIAGGLFGLSRSSRVADQIERVEDSEGAALALTMLARAYDWRSFSSELRRNPEWSRFLTPLQQSLILTLKSLSEEDTPDSIGASYVDRLLESYRVPLHVLISDLMELEVSRWMGDEFVRANDERELDELRDALRRSRIEK